MHEKSYVEDKQRKYRKKYNQDPENKKRHNELKKQYREKKIDGTINSATSEPMRYIRTLTIEVNQDWREILEKYCKDNGIAVASFLRGSVEAMMKMTGDTSFDDYYAGDVYKNVNPIGIVEDELIGSVDIECKPRRFAVKSKNK